jgi:hypothetical protein
MIGFSGGPPTLLGDSLIVNRGGGRCVAGLDPADLREHDGPILVCEVGESQRRGLVRPEVFRAAGGGPIDRGVERAIAVIEPRLDRGGRRQSASKALWSVVRLNSISNRRRARSRVRVAFACRGRATRSWGLVDASVRRRIVAVSGEGNVVAKLRWWSSSRVLSGTMQWRLRSAPTRSIGGAGTHRPKVCPDGSRGGCSSRSFPVHRSGPESAVERLHVRVEPGLAMETAHRTQTVLMFTNSLMP